MKERLSRTRGTGKSLKTWHAGRADKKKRKKGREESANVTRPAKENEEEEVEEGGGVVGTDIGEEQASEGGVKEKERGLVNRTSSNKIQTRKEYVQS